ncbi:MAG: ABC transporter permease [Pseudomonadales bacterium]
MARIVTLAAKELLLLRRDVHGLALLFVMPSLFILIMSFALSDRYDSHNPTISYYLIDTEKNAASEALIQTLTERVEFERLTDSENDMQSLLQKTRDDNAQFLLVINSDHIQQLMNGGAALELHVAPGTDRVTAQLFAASLREQLSTIYIQQSLDDAFGSSRLDTGIDMDMGQALTVHSLYLGGAGQQQTPTAVQQNVPAWLLFAMFFITIPLSTTLIREREQGTLARLRSMGVGSYQFLLGKLVPFFIVNMLQVGAMLLVGIYLIPALGGERLEILGSAGALLVISSAAALAAVSYALLIANLASTTEQATIAAGVCNIIMAALGGIMVPRFIMPPVMQDLSQWSPMAWGLDGFLDILLRAGDIADVLPEAGRLIALAALLLVLASLLSKNQLTR